MCERDLVVASMRARPKINAPLRARLHPAGRRHGDPAFPARYAGYLSVRLHPVPCPAGASTRAAGAFILRRALNGILAIVIAGLGFGEARASSPLRDVQLAELDKLRAQVADQVHLTAFDLLDELVFKWTNAPVFEAQTPVVLASVTVPVGLGTGLQALLENHLVAVLSENPSTHIQLVHCPACTAVVVHSGPEGTVVSRGIDNPSVLAELGTSTGRHALFIDIEAEGSWLVLRARLTQLTPTLPIVWSHTLTTSAAVPALLRQPTALKSAADAREEYLNALTGRGSLSVPVCLAVRTYKKPDGSGVPPPPFLWLESGVELSPTNARAWTSSLLVGYSFIPAAYQGILGQARISRLLTGRTRSLLRPDVYAFVGGAAVSVWGPATASFQTDVLNSDQIIALIEGEGPRTSFGAFQVGVDLRVGNRIGTAAFLESVPDLANSENLGNYIRVLGIGFPTLGTEVAFWF